VTPASTCAKRSKIDASFSAGIPIPVSSTETRTASPSSTSASDTVTRPPRSVNFSAFPTRFTTTFSSASRSANTAGGASARASSSTTPLRSASAEAAATTSPHSPARSSRARDTVFCPLSTRDRSSRSLISFSSRIPFRCMVPSVSPTHEGSSEARERTCSSGASMRVRGVRSS